MKCIFKNIEIKSIATCLPDKVVEMSSYADKFGAKVVEETIKGSGIERLHEARIGETTADLCQRAAELIFEEESIDRNTIDGIVFVSQTFDYFNPATSCVLQGKLGLSKDCVCFDISFGCSGYINGVLQAASLISSGVCSNVLLLAGDTNSKINNKEDKSSVMVFGDAGSATIIGKGDFVGSTEETFDIIIKKNKKYTKGNYQYQITSAKTNGKGWFRRSSGCCGAG